MGTKRTWLILTMTLIAARVGAQHASIVTYDILIEGQLPEQLSRYVITPFFSIDTTRTDIFAITFSADNRLVEPCKKLAPDSNRVSIQVPANLENRLMFYSEKDFGHFLPTVIAVSQLKKDTINRIALPYLEGYSFRWPDHLGRSCSTPSKSTENQKPTIIEGSLKKPGQSGREQLSARILHKTRSSTYAHATELLLSSSYWRAKRFCMKEDLLFPADPADMYEMLKLFSVPEVSEIYASFYKNRSSAVSGRKENKNPCQVFVSAPAFNAERTIAVIRTASSDNNSLRELLIFEKRLRGYILTGKVVGGHYGDALEGSPSEFFSDMRNVRLFY